MLPGDVPLNETPFLKEVVFEEFLPAENTPSDVLEVTVRAEFQMLVLRESDLTALTTAVLDAALEAGFVPAGPPVSPTSTWRSRGFGTSEGRPTTGAAPADRSRRPTSQTLR